MTQIIVKYAVYKRAKILFNNFKNKIIEPDFSTFIMTYNLIKNIIHTNNVLIKIHPKCVSTSKKYSNYTASFNLPSYLFFKLLQSDGQLTFSFNS